jgi:hypothetical protein
MGARQLPADFGDLSGRLSLRQNDFGESDAAQTVEIQRVIRGGHWCGFYPPNRLKLRHRGGIVAARSLIPLVEGSGCKSRAAPATVTGDAPGEKPLDA